MEPVGIVGLVASCVGLTARAVASAKELDDFIQCYRAANKSVAKLAHQLRLFAVSVEQLEKLMDGQPTMSDRLKDTVRSSLQDCDDIIGDLEEHVQKVVSNGDGSKGLAFASKIRLLWSQGSVGKEEQTLHRQLQTVMLLVNLVRENDAGKQNSALNQPASKKTIAKSARDARSIREGKDTRSISTSISSSSRWSSSTNTEVEFGIDEEILKSGPYVTNYRALLAKSMMDGKKAPSAQIQPKNNAPSSEVKREESAPAIPAVTTVPLVAVHTSSSEVKGEECAPMAPTVTTLPRRVAHPLPSAEWAPAIPALTTSPPRAAPTPQPKGHQPALVSSSGPDSERVPTAAEMQTAKAARIRAKKRRAQTTKRMSSSVEVFVDKEPETRDPEEHPPTPIIPCPVSKPAPTETTKAPAASTTSVDPAPIAQAKVAQREPRPDLDNALLKKLMDSAFPPVKPNSPRNNEKTKVVFPDAMVKPTIQSYQSDDQDLSDLCDACEEGNFKWAKYLVEEKSIVLNWASNPTTMKTPLHLAVETGRKDMVDLLLEHSVNPNIPDKKGHTPFLYAIEQVINHGMPLDIAQSLVGHGASLGCFITPKPLVGDTCVRRRPQPLVAAVSGGHLALARFLLSLDYTGDGRNDQGENVISIAVASGRADLTELLLQNPCSAGEPDRMGRQPLLVATMEGRRDLVQLLIDRDDSERCCDHDGFSPLNFAVKRILEMNDDLGLAQLVAEDETLLAPNGCPLILLAIAARHVELVKLLMEHGADCDKEWDGLSPLGLAVEKRDLDMVSLLVQEGRAAVDKLEMDKTSPLLNAVRKGDAEMVARLLETDHEPSFESETMCPQTPLCAACCEGDAGLVKRLLDWDVRVGGWSAEPLCGKLYGPDNGKIWSAFADLAVRQYGPLHVAARLSPELTRLLLDAGADVSDDAKVNYQGSLSELICEGDEEEDAEEGDEMVRDVTPLHLAVGSSAGILIADGKANVFAKDGRGRTPLFWAASFLVPGRESENLQAVEANLAEGSPVNLRDIHGFTPLWYVAKGMFMCGNPAKGKGSGVIWKCYMVLDTLRCYISIARALLAARAKTNVQRKDDTSHDPETIKDVLEKTLDCYMPHVPELQHEFEQLKKDLSMK
ncbi:hypothetical protein ACHAPT_012905 [Fusarium lateritium]